MASATVTVARMIGMAIGVAVLTAYGSTTINRLYDELYAAPDGWKAVHPRGAPRPAAARRARRRRARGVGRGRGGRDHRRAVPRRRRRDGRRGPAGARARPAARVCWRPIAARSRSRRMSRGSPMDATSDAPPSPSEPAAADPVRIVCWSPAGVAESGDVGRAGVDARRPRRRASGSTSPSPPTDVVRTVAKRPRPAPADRRRHRRAQPAGEGRDLDDMIHVVLFDSSTEARSGRPRSTSSSARASCSPSTTPAATSAAALQLAAASARSSRRAPTSCCTRSPTAIVDGYFPVLDALADEIDELQDEVIESPTEWTLQRLFALKRELIALRRAMSPAREVFNQLTNRDLDARSRRSTSSTSATSTTT